ncbi:hypothetical protein Bhyg_05371 [Pseudolycoriella hygida]|uniref:Uncharacterized protein n=1 Tax=Pseudolycoriella hygida TaxID=35572 RepID=A0A9Q0NHH0_9DIPT|nr:hypothetical protein Bhyg_05371 [Pseudolycoriella hygida]
MHLLNNLADLNTPNHKPEFNFTLFLFMKPSNIRYRRR